MFITEAHNQSPLSITYCNSDQLGWDSFELSLRTAWFLIDYRQLEPENVGPVSILRTNAFINFSDAEDFLQSIADQKNLDLKTVYLIYPLRTENKSNWQLAKIKKIWTSQKRVGIKKLYLFETEDGQKFLESGFFENQDFASFSTLAHDFNTLK